jgi:hypothetical protein
LARQTSGVVVVSERVEPGVFGNSLIVLRSSDLLVRLVSDRNQLFAEVASSNRPDDWIDLPRLSEFLPAPLEWPFALGVAAEYVRTHFSRILDALGPGRALADAALAKREAEAMERLGLNTHRKPHD